MDIPKEVQLILENLQKAGFQAHIVGGCVRDLLRNVEPQDWDITTSAEPEEIQKVFPKSFYANTFGTVTVQVSRLRRGEARPTKLGGGNPIKEVEITTYRVEETYTDKRHPDKLRFAKNLDEDLKRRDFTINAMAADYDGNN